MLKNTQFSSFLGTFGPSGTPNGHFVPGKWPKPIILDVSHPDPTMIHSDTAIWGAQGDLWPQIPNFHHFWALLSPPAPPNGHFVPGKLPKPITLDVSHPDPTMIHSDPAIWGAQGDLWPKIPNFRHFWALLGPLVLPHGHFVSGK